MKPRSDSILDGLPANQQESLERWLFEENLSLDGAKDRLWQDFSVRSSRSAVHTWYHKRAQERLLAKIAGAARASKQVVAAFQANPDNSYDALLGLIGQSALEAKMKGEELSLENLKDLAELTRLGLEARHDTRALEIKERDLNLRKDKFEFSAAEACLKHLPALRQIGANKGLDERSKIQQIRLRLFGELPQEGKPG
jgi:hypothetical protein